MFETVVHYAEKSGRLVMPNIDEWTNMLFPGEEIPALKCHGGEEQE